MSFRSISVVSQLHLRCNGGKRGVLSFLSAHVGDVAADPRAALVRVVKAKAKAKVKPKAAISKVRRVSKRVRTQAADAAERDARLKEVVGRVSTDRPTDRPSRTLSS